MSHDPTHKLIYMANQIGKFFAPQAHDKAVAGIANHIAKFWAVSMRKRIYQHLDAGGEGLDPLVKEALQNLKTKQSHEPEFAG